MALIKCPDCNKKISSLSNACPKCGLPVTDETRHIAAKRLAANRRLQMIFALPVVLFFYWLFSPHEPERNVPSPLDQQQVQLYTESINKALNTPAFQGYELSFEFLESNKCCVVLTYRAGMSTKRLELAGLAACGGIVLEQIRQGHNAYDESLIAVARVETVTPDGNFNIHGAAIWNYQKKDMVWIPN